MSDYNYSNKERFSLGYKEKGGWDIDTSERTQKESDGGHIPGGINGKKQLMFPKMKT